MDPVEALKHTRTLIRVAGQQHDVDLIHQILAEAEALIAKALPPRRKHIIVLQETDEAV